MERRKVVGSIFAGAAAAATIRVAKAADKEIEIYTDHWKKSKALTLKVAEAMPAENYDYKPFADARAFGGELQHLAQAEGDFISAGWAREARPRRRGTTSPKPPP